MTVLGYWIPLFYTHSHLYTNTPNNPPPSPLEVYIPVCICTYTYIYILIFNSLPTIINLYSTQLMLFEGRGYVLFISSSLSTTLPFKKDSVHVCLINTWMKEWINKFEHQIDLLWMVWSSKLLKCKLVVIFIPFHYPSHPLIILLAVFYKTLWA